MDDRDDAISQGGQYGEGFDKENCNDEIDDYEQSECQTLKKPLSFDVSHVNNLLHQLEGKSLSFRMFARDTKASRNM